jgi:ligand-binding SRPBCC domain-containing protein
MSKSPQIIRLSSALRAAPETVWQHASSLRGMNQELWPLHMSGPDWTVLTPELPVGEPLFRSVVSLLRVFVLDFHEFKLVRVNPGQSFHEASRSLLERRWEHVRTITEEPGGCVVTDELEFEPRLLPLLVAAIVRRVFEHRHAFLRRRFGVLSQRP